MIKTLSYVSDIPVNSRKIAFQAMHAFVNGMLYVILCACPRLYTVTEEAKTLRALPCGVIVN